MACRSSWFRQAENSFAIAAAPDSGQIGAPPASLVATHPVVDRTNAIDRSLGRREEQVVTAVLALNVKAPKAFVLLAPLFRRLGSRNEDKWRASHAK